MLGGRCASGVLACAAALHSALNAMVESSHSTPVAEVELDLPFVWFG